MLLQVRARSKSRPLRADFDLPALRARLAALDFREIEDCAAEEIAARYAPERAPTRRGDEVRARPVDARAERVRRASAADRLDFEA